MKPSGGKPGSRLAQQQSLRSRTQRGPPLEPRELEDLEILVRDPQRLGLSHDFAQAAAELKPPRGSRSRSSRRPRRGSAPTG